MSRARLLVRLLLLLLLLAFAERGLFALRHAALTAAVGWNELLFALAAGLRFDLALAASGVLITHLGSYLAARLFHLPFAATLRACAYPLIAGLALLHGADGLYFEEAGRHLGYEIREGLNSAGDLAGLMFSRYRTDLLLQLLLMAPLLTLAHRLLRDDRPTQRTLVLEAELLASLALCVILIRGGLQSIPLEPLHAQAQGDASRAALALNGAYNALHSLASGRNLRPAIALAPPTTEERGQLQALYAGAGTPPALAHRPRNVLLLLLESWSGNYLSAYGHPEPTTPNFDRLRAEGLTTRGMLAGGHRTTEGMFATFCSAQNPLGATVAQSQLQQYPYQCLPRLLRDAGYRTAFFQGTHENTSGTGDFARLLGFEEGFARETISEHRLPLNGWGLQDPDIYEFVLKEIRATDRPWLFAVNTNSTHDIQLPPGVAARFPGETTLARYLSVLHFADQALGGLLTALEHEGRLADTAVVILADHAGMTPERSGQHYFIPFALYAPGTLPPRQLEHIASQRDVAPTLLDLLGKPAVPHFSGRSLLRGAGPADYYHAGRLGWLEGDKGIEISLQGDAPICFAATPAFVPAACDGDLPALRNRALAFTRASQWLLFSGRTTEFGRLLVPE